MNGEDVCKGKLRLLLYEDEERVIPAVLETVILDHKYFCKCRDYHHAYMEGKTAVDAIALVKKYKSHRRVPMSATE